MRRVLLTAACSVLVAGALSNGCVGRSARAPGAGQYAANPPLDPNAPATSATVTLKPEQRFQVLEGFGASIAWYLEQVAFNDEPGLYELLFPELGLDILRFRNRFERSDPGDGNLKQEVDIFQRASKALGHPPKLLLTSWSPPAGLKASGKEKCKSNPDCTLKKEGGSFVYEAFADWWARSIEHYRSIGLAPDFVSMQNEPSFLPPDWEGCKFEPEETAEYPGYGKALEAFHRKVSALDAPPKILGPEVLGVHYDRVQKYLAGMNSELVYGVAHHLYERGDDDMWDWRDPGPDSFLDELRAVAQATDKPLFQTEFNTDEDQGIDGGFETAWLMHHSLVTEGVAAWLYWDLIWVDTKGLVTMKGRKPAPRDHYYSMRHFARYTDPGDTRVGAETSDGKLLASAYLAPGASRLTVVLLNTSHRPIDVQLDSGSFAATAREAYVTTYRPGRSKRWQAADASGALRLPARAVATVVIAGAP